MNICKYAFIRIAYVLMMLLSMNSFANTWSECLTVDAVSDYQAYDNSIVFHTTTNSATCTGSGGWPQQWRIINGTAGHTTETMKSSLSVLLAAKVSGEKIKLFHLNNGSFCTVQIVSIGGYGGGCN